MNARTELPGTEADSETSAKLLEKVLQANRRARRARALYFSAPPKFVGPLWPPDAIEQARGDAHREAIARHLNRRQVVPVLPLAPAANEPMPRITLSCQDAGLIASALMTLLTACERIQAEQPARQFLSPRVRPAVERLVGLLGGQMGRP